jgi:hypothetical protein
MFQKIESHLGPELLQPGATVICFPLEGSTAKDFNLSDIQNFLLYIVTAVRDEIVSLQLSEDKLHDDATGNEDTHIIKFFHELIEEGKWWARLAF